MTCQFSNPKSIGPGGIIQTAKVGDNFQFQTATCTDETTTTIPGSTTGPDRYQLITSTNGQNFYLDKSINYGQYIGIAMLLIFFILACLGILYTLIFRRKY